jgi:hypothetical protein
MLYNICESHLFHFTDYFKMEELFNVVHVILYRLYTWLKTHLYNIQIELNVLLLLLLLDLEIKSRKKFNITLKIETFHNVNTLLGIFKTGIILLFNRPIFKTSHITLPRKGWIYVSKLKWEKGNDDRCHTKSSLDLHKNEAIAFLIFPYFVLNENILFWNIFYPRAEVSHVSLLYLSRLSIPSKSSSYGWFMVLNTTFNIILAI